MSINFNPGPKILAILDAHQWGQIELNELTPTVGGTGITKHNARFARIDSGATTLGTAELKTTDEAGWSAGENRKAINWTKPITLHMVVSLRGSTTNGESRVSLGKTAADGIGDLARQAIGIRLDANALKGICHNGTSETVVDLSTTLALNIANRITIYSDGAGNVEWLVNKVSKGSSANGPATNGTTDESVWQAESANNANNAIQSLVVHDIKYYLEQ